MVVFFQSNKKIVGDTCRINLIPVCHLFVPLRIGLWETFHSWPYLWPYTWGVIHNHLPTPIVSMYGIFSYMYHKNQPNVATYIPYMDPMGLWWFSKYWRDNTQFFHWIRLNPHGFSGEERVLTSGVPTFSKMGIVWGHPGEKAMTAWYFRRLIRRYPLQLHFLGGFR